PPDPARTNDLERADASENLGWLRDTVIPSGTRRGRRAEVIASPRPYRKCGAFAPELLAHLILNPLVGAHEALLERDLGFPLQHLAQPGVVRVAPAYALRSGHVPLADANSGDSSQYVGEFVDRHYPLLPEVERLVMVRSHQLVDSLDAVIDVAEGARLRAVAPDFDLASSPQFRVRNLAAECCRRLFATALPGAVRPEHVVETDDTRFHAVVFAVVG